MHLRAVRILSTKCNIETSVQQKQFEFTVKITAHRETSGTAVAAFIRLLFIYGAVPLMSSPVMPGLTRGCEIGIKLHRNAPNRTTGSGLQRATIGNIVMGWLLTLPAAIMLSATLYWAFIQSF
jgi:phosphate/sulfate permease